MLSEKDSTSYEITPQTMAVMVHHTQKGNIGTLVLEEQNEYYVDQMPSKIIDESCKFYGASLKGQQDGTRSVCGITHKAPISIAPLSGMYYFPSASPVNENCSWFAHSHIDKLHDLGQRWVELEFKNGRTVSLPISYGSMLNQIQRTAQYRYLLDKRLKNL